MPKTIEWKNTKGEIITLYVQGEGITSSGEPCYTVSKQPNSPYVFNVTKRSAV